MGSALGPMMDEDAGAVGLADATTASTMTAIVQRRYGRPTCSSPRRSTSRWLAMTTCSCACTRPSSTLANDLLRKETKWGQSKS